MLNPANHKNHANHGDNSSPMPSATTLLAAARFRRWLLLGLVLSLPFFIYAMEKLSPFVMEVSLMEISMALQRAMAL